MQHNKTGMTEGQAKELRNSDLWKSVNIELDYRIQCRMNALKNCDSEELKTLQNIIASYEELKRLPDDVVERENDVIEA